MDFFRRLNQSYPPRPSPLGTSQQQSSPQRPSSGTPAASPESRRSHESHRNHAPSRSTTSPYARTSPTSPATGFGQRSVSRPSSLRGDAPSTDKSAQSHRRHGSLDRKEPSTTHRRNQSQPFLRYRDGLLGHRDMNPPPHDSVHRTSLGSSGSPGYSGQHEHSAPPAFGNRQMPPPSPPHTYGSRAQSANAPPSSSMLPRDPSSGQSHRPGSSMSISSMLGGNSEHPARDSGPSFFSRPSSLFGSGQPSSATGAMSPPSGPARPSPLDHPLFRRSRTPEKSLSSKIQTGRPSRSGSGSGSQLFSEQSRFGGLSRGPSSSQFPDKPHSTHPSPRISSAEAPPNEPRRMSLSGPIARPSSQPPHADGPTRAPAYSPISRPSGSVSERPFESGPRSASTSYMGQDSALSRLGSLFGDRRSEDPLYRDRDRTASHATDAKASRGASSRFGSLYKDREPVERHSGASTWEQRSHPTSPETRRFPAPESASGFGFGAIQSYTKSLGSQPGGGRQPPSSLQSRHSQPTSPPQESPFKQTQPPRIGSNPAGASAVPGLFSLSTTEDTRRKGSDELFHHRNLLAVGADGKRGGRASPLPQAVQGAQAPFIGPSGESGIKNELGRVFSGIGSGVGGVTASSANSGSPTPMTSSPFKRDSFNGRPASGEVFDESKIARPESATSSKRARKSQDEDPQMDLEGSTLSARGNRRARHPHQHHHHHHHHHHRHKLEEEAALAGLHRPPSTANYLHSTSTPADGAPASASGHHHHHHHHHHHAPRPATLPVPVSTPLREPRITVNIEPLLSSVADRPRHHLGSTLYTPRISAPSAKASADSAKFGYTTIPQPLPRFEGRENCTFTVRVPRFRIDANHREEICARRALWGTGVYTDDSDPVAAAIHSGYIRGAWGEDVDESMLDLEIKDTYQHAPQPAVNGTDASKTDAQASKEPRLPPVPPADKDLHITLLILPRLERYDSAVLFGIKSRVWDGRHDGMSFKVHRIDWVDEGVGRGEERSGEARRKRLRTLMQSGRICTGPAMAKMDVLRQSGVQVPRALDGKNQLAPVQPVS